MSQPIPKDYYVKYLTPQFRQKLELLLIFCTHNLFSPFPLHSNSFRKVRTYCTCFQRPVHSNIPRNTGLQTQEGHAPWRSLRMLERFSSCHSNRCYPGSCLVSTGERGDYRLQNNQVNCTQLKRKPFQIKRIADK